MMPTTITKPPMVWLAVIFSFKNIRASSITGREKAPLKSATTLVNEVMLYPMLIARYASVSPSPMKTKNFHIGRSVITKLILCNLHNARIARVMNKYMNIVYESQSSPPRNLSQNNVQNAASSVANAVSFNPGICAKLMRRARKACRSLRAA